MVNLITKILVEVKFLIFQYKVAIWSYYKPEYSVRVESLSESHSSRALGLGFILFIDTCLHSSTVYLSL